MKFAMKEHEELINIPKLSTYNRISGGQPRYLYSETQSESGQSIHWIHFKRPNLLICIWRSNRKANLLDKASFEAKPLIEWRCLLFNRIVRKVIACYQKNKGWEKVNCENWHGQSSFSETTFFSCFVLIWFGRLYVTWYQWIVFSLFNVMSYLILYVK